MPIPNLIVWNLLYWIGISPDGWLNFIGSTISGIGGAVITAVIAYKIMKEQIRKEHEFQEESKKEQMLIDKESRKKQIEWENQLQKYQIFKNYQIQIILESSTIFYEWFVLIGQLNSRFKLTISYLKHGDMQKYMWALDETYSCSRELLNLCYKLMSKLDQIAEMMKQFEYAKGMFNNFDNQYYEISHKLMSDLNDIANQNGQKKILKQECQQLVKEKKLDEQFKLMTECADKYKNFLRALNKSLQKVAFEDLAKQ